MQRLGFWNSFVFFWFFQLQPKPEVLKISMGVFSTHFFPLISILAPKIMKEWNNQLLASYWGSLLNFGKRYKADILVIFDRWQKLQLGLDAQSNQKILKGIYSLRFSKKMIEIYVYQKHRIFSMYLDLSEARFLLQALFSVNVDEMGLPERVVEVGKVKKNMV